jgi:hypothetical protein
MAPSGQTTPLLLDHSHLVVLWAWLNDALFLFLSVAVKRLVKLVKDVRQTEQI